MTLPLVTIAIPTYNQPQSLEKAIQSAIDQTYSNKEIIVSEDSENEDAYKKLRLLKEKYPDIKFFINPERLGRVGNYKKLLTEYATGDFYINLDGDDFYTNNNYIKNGIEKIKQEGFDNILFYQGAHFSETNKGEVMFSPKIKNHEEVLNGKEYLSRYFEISHFSHMSTIYKRDIAIRSGFYEKDIISADIYSFFKLITNHPGKKIILSKEVSGMWVQHEKNASKSLELRQHLKNFNLFTETFFRQLKTKGFSKPSSIKWYGKAFFTYWYIHFIKKIIVKKRTQK